MPTTATNDRLTVTEAIWAAESLLTPMAGAACRDFPDHQEAHRLATLGMELVDYAMTKMEDAARDNRTAAQLGQLVHPTTGTTYPQLNALFTRFELAQQTARQWL